MPRKRGQPARLAAFKEMAAKIRLLIRNIQFLSDLKELRKLDDPYGSKYAHASPKALEEADKALDEFAPSKLGNLEIKFPEHKPIHSYWDFLRKWDLEWFPSELFLHPSEALTGSDAVAGGEPLPQTPSDFEKVIGEALREARQDQKFKDMLRPAVIASEPFDKWEKEQVEGWDGTDQVIEVPDHIPGPGTVLNIQVDLSYPQDVIEAEIKREVRQAKDSREKLQETGLLPPRPQRLRLDRIDIQLKVYDLAKAGKTFKEIHIETHRPVSTVKSDLLAASKKIASLVIPALSPPRVSKESLPLVDFDQDNHTSKCPQCSAAKWLEDMCGPAKCYANQDYVSQRDRPVVDTERGLRKF